MIKANGSLDTRLEAVKGGTGEPGSFVRGIIIDQQKRYYMAGSFSFYEAKKAGGLVRLKGGE
jgi:hypothetical protein